MSNTPGFTDVTPDELRRFLDAQDENDYVLIDVRQPEEYTAGHIPGAILIPLGELEARFSDLPADKEMIFNCKSGGRSRAAATIVAESGVFPHRIYNLLGGFMAWTGRAVQGLPKVQVFDAIKTPQELLQKAMDLEKGAFLFYTCITDQYASESFVKIIEPLVDVEVAHAKLLYQFMDSEADHVKRFEEMFEGLKGDILEGGKNLEDVLQQINHMEGSLCLNILELALDIEYAAYDLYKNSAEIVAHEHTQRALLTIAQAEKNHMKTIAKAVAQCSALV